MSAGTSQLDLLGEASAAAQRLAERVERAGSLDELQRASRDLFDLIRTLHGWGVGIRYLGRLVSELNRRILNRVYPFVVPPAVVENSCLLVMGSEGREEQILKTDQDNAIILRDDFECPELARIAGALTETLVDLGYPRCPGNIMVSNPYWAKPLKAYKSELFRWIQEPDEEACLRFAIFFDAAAVAGDESLLREAREYLFGRLRDHPVFYSHFAKVALRFATPLGWLDRFVVEKKERRGELDVKKGGVFPIVHGARSLTLERRLDCNNTLERIEALHEAGLVDRRLAGDLGAAFEFLGAVRLEAGLARFEQGQPVDNYVRPDSLGRLDRSLLKESFKVVNDFKRWLTRHFRLDMVG